MNTRIAPNDHQVRSDFQMQATPGTQMGKVETPETPNFVPDDDRKAIAAVHKNVLQEHKLNESMSYVNDLSESDVDYVCKLVEERLRVGLKRTELSGKWLSRVLMCSNKTLCAKYERGTPVSVIFKGELEVKTDDLRDKFMELPPSARERLLKELGHC